MTESGIDMSDDEQQQGAAYGGRMESATKGAARCVQKYNTINTSALHPSSSQIAAVYR